MAGAHGNDSSGNICFLSLKAPCYPPQAWAPDWINRKAANTERNKQERWLLRQPDQPLPVQTKPAITTQSPRKTDQCPEAKQKGTERIGLIPPPTPHPMEQRQHTRKRQVFVSYLRCDSKRELLRGKSPTYPRPIEKRHSSGEQSRAMSFPDDNQPLAPTESFVLSRTLSI